MCAHFKRRITPHKTHIHQIMIYLIGNIFPTLEQRITAYTLGGNRYFPQCVGISRSQTKMAERLPQEFGVTEISGIRCGVRVQWDRNTDLGKPT